MSMIVNCYFALIAIVVLVMLKQGLSRKVDFFSLRNLYLVSFIIYQLISPAIALKTGDYKSFRLQAPEQTGKAFLAMATVYLIVFFISYHKVRLTAWIAKKCSGPPREINDYLLMTLAVCLVLIAVPLRFAVPVSIVKVCTQIALALVGLASAICGWVWSNRRSNIPLTLLVGVILAVSVTISLTSVFGRRPLIGVALGFVWGVYQRRARFVSPAKMLLYTLPFFLAASVIVASFTAIRNKSIKQGQSAQETIQKMINSDLRGGFTQILGGQACGSAALWTFEYWPNSAERKFLYSLRYMGIWYVPRFMWPEKPSPLGNYIAPYAKLYGVSWERITIPPGVIGYAQAEGGMIAAIIYALFFGQLFRFFDDLVKLNPNNTYIILPIGCCLGQPLGLARGCIAIFTNLLVLGFISSFAILYVFNTMFGHRLQQRGYMLAWPQYR